MKTFCLTDPGKVRDHNEDSVLIINKKSGDVLLAIADGMGGHSAGEVASNIAISYLGNHFQESFEHKDKLGAASWLRDSVDSINRLIFEHEKTHPESKGMGTTLVAAIVTKDYILFGNVGDSSGFVFKGGNLYKVTKDHTLVNLLVETGELTKEEAVNHPRKNVLMRALGANNPIDVDIFDVDTSCDGIFLCSDGLTNMLSVSQIEKVLNSDLTIEEKIVKLIKKSNLRGGTDNISIACLQKESGE